VPALKFLPRCYETQRLRACCFRRRGRRRSQRLQRRRATRRTARSKV
jgi:hypothetical protein